MTKEHVAFACPCGETRFHLLIGGVVECAGCGRIGDNHWRPGKFARKTELTKITPLPVKEKRVRSSFIAGQLGVGQEKIDDLIARTRERLIILESPENKEKAELEYREYFDKNLGMNRQCFMLNDEQCSLITGLARRVL